MSLKTNLVAYWKLDETSGTRVDANGSKDLSASGSVASTTGKINNAADFTNLGGFLTRTDSTFNFGNTSFSIACWVKFDTLNAGVYIIFQGRTSNNDLSYQLTNSGDANNREFRFGIISVAGDGVNITDNIRRSTGTWYYIVAWYDSGSGQLGLSVNNSSVTTSTGVVTPRSDGVGASFVASSGFLDGQLDEMGVWSRVLDSTEMANLYNSGSGLSYDEFLPPSTGTASGDSSASGVGSALFGSTGTASGDSSASGVGNFVGGGTGTASATSSASGVGASRAASVGTASATSSASGVGASRAASVGTASATSSAVGASPLPFSTTVQIARSPNKIVIPLGNSVTVTYTISGVGTTTAQLIRTDGSVPVSLTCNGASHTVSFTPTLSQIYFIRATDDNGSVTDRLEIIVQQSLTAVDPTTSPTIVTARSGNWTDTNPSTSPWPSGILPGVNDIVSNSHTIKANSRSDGSGNILQCARFINESGGVLNIWNDNGTAAAVWMTDYVGKTGSEINIDSTYTSGRVSVLLMRNRPFHANDTALNSPDGYANYWNAVDVRGGNFIMKGTTVTPFVRAAGDIAQGATYIDLIAPVTGWAQSFLLSIPDTRGTRDIATDFTDQLEIAVVRGIGPDASGNENQRVYLMRPTQFAHPMARNVNGTPAIRTWDNEPLAAHITCLSKTTGVITEDPTGIGTLGGQPRAHMLLNGGGRVDCRDAMVSHGMGRCTQTILDPIWDRSPGYNPQYYRLFPMLTYDLHGPVGGLGYDSDVDEPEFEPGNPANTFSLDGPSHRFINCLVVDPLENNSGTSVTYSVTYDATVDMGLLPIAIGGWVHFFTNYGEYKRCIGFNFSGTCWGISDGTVTRNMFANNIVSRTEGRGNRLDLNNLLTQGSGWILGSLAQWFRGNIASDAGGFGPHLDQYSFGIINVDSRNGNYTPPDPRYYMAWTPNFQGASLLNSSDRTGYDNQLSVFLDWSDNEGYGSARHIVPYTIGIRGSLSGPYATTSDIYMRRQTVWATYHFACFPYGNYRLIKDSWFCRADYAQRPAFDVNTDYVQSEITYLNWDMEGFSTLVAVSAQFGTQNDPDQPDPGGIGRLMVRGGRYVVDGLIFAQKNGGSGNASGFYGQTIIIGGDRDTGNSSDIVTVIHPTGGNPVYVYLDYDDINDFHYSNGYNIIAPNVIQVNRLNNYNYDVYADVQSPSAILPQSYDPSHNPPQINGTTTWGAPEFGMTNQQCHDKYQAMPTHPANATEAMFQGVLKAGWPDSSTPGMCWGNALMTASSTTVTWLNGRRGPTSGTADLVAQSTQNGTGTASGNSAAAANSNSIFSLIPSGGTLAGGVADVTMSGKFDEVMTGGSLAGGTSTTTATYRSVASSGTLISGFADIVCTYIDSDSEGVLCGGTTNISGIYNVITSGQALAGGLADVTMNGKFDEVMTGGSLAGGNAQFNKRISISPQNGCAINGQAILLRLALPTTTGGSLINGSIQIRATYLCSPSGSTYLSGSFKEASKTYDEIASGGMAAFGFAVKGFRRTLRKKMYCVAEKGHKLQVIRSCGSRTAEGYVAFIEIENLIRYGRYNQDRI
jgi:hypothetical protein